MTNNTYHEEIPDQDVVDQLERLERGAMTQTMLEKITQAMFDAIEATAFDSDGVALQGGRIYFNGDFDAYAVARAALQALREPTEEMVNAGAAMHVFGGAYVGETGAEAAFSAMIDAALQEKPA